MGTSRAAPGTTAAEAPPRGAGPAPAPERPAAALEQVVQRTCDLTAAAPRLIARHAETPRIRFDLRGQAAGQFRLGPGGEPAIRYNPALLARHEAEFLAQTVPHEVAHYLAYLRFGRGIRPHGPEWQQIMHALGADPRRCHDFDVSGLATRRMRRHVYHCRCGEHALTSIRHHRILRGASYFCRTCGQPLRPGADAAGQRET